MIQEIRDELFSLIPIKMDYVHDIYAYASDPENTLYMSWPTHTSIGQTIGFINHTLNLYKTGNHYNWAIYHNADKKVIGTGGLIGYKDENDFVEIGYIISKHYWNTGLGTKIIQVLVDFAYSNLNINRINAYCNSNNKASQRILLKNRFIYNGFKKYQLIKIPEPMDAMEFILTKDMI